MAAGTIDVASLSRGGYWKLFTRLIEMARIGATAGCLGWLLFWFALVPDFHNLTTRISSVLSIASFLAATGAGFTASFIMARTGNRLGTRGDRIVHLVQAAYAILAGLSGIYAHFRWPPTG